MSVRRSQLSLVALALCGCGGVSPSPTAMAARNLPAADPGVDVDAVRRDEQAARLLLEQRHHAEAAALAERILERDPRSARAHAVLGVALLEQALADDPPDFGQQNRADGETLTAVTLQPTDAVVGQLRVSFLARSGHLSAAAAAAEATLARAVPSDDPDRLALVRAAGNLCCELGEEQRALVHLRELAAVQRDDRDLQFRLGSSLLRTATGADGAIEAAAAFARGVELAPGDGELRLGVVAAHVRAAEFARSDGKTDLANQQLGLAAQVAAAAVAQFPESAKESFTVGVVAELRQDRAGAMAAYERALQQDRDHLGSLLNLASLLAGDPGTEPRARDLWRRALTGPRRDELSAAERERLTALIGR
jgi:tetratricopeptide (TPR) repeat protein